MADGLAPLEIMKGLDTARIGRKILYYTSLVSTMDTAREKARDGAEEGTVIIAGEQTGGRGRLQRAWISPQGNIALSIILRPTLASLPYIVMLAALAASSSIASVSGQKTRIKWPNDVLIDGKKVCGMLVENEMKGKKVDFCILGIGINTGLDVHRYTEIAHTAASLKAPAGDALRLNLIRQLLAEIDRLYLILPDGGYIYKSWRDNLVTLGKQVKATWGKQVVEGVAEDVDAGGALMIRKADGKLTKVVAGDVTLKE